MKQLNIRKKGLSKLVESASSSITIKAKKQINNDIVVKNSKLGKSIDNKYHQNIPGAVYLVVKITKHPKDLTN